MNKNSVHESTTNRKPFAHNHLDVQMCHSPKQQQQQNKHKQTNKKTPKKAVFRAGISGLKFTPTHLSVIVKFDLGWS